MRLRDLLRYGGQTQQEIRPGIWVTARPLVGPFSWRLRDAWAVLTGKADALYWPTADDPTTWCAVPTKADGLGDGYGVTTERGDLHRQEVLAL